MSSRGQARQPLQLSWRFTILKLAATTSSARGTVQTWYLHLLRNINAPVPERNASAAQTSAYKRLEVITWRSSRYNQFYMVRLYGPENKDLETTKETLLQEDTPFEEQVHLGSSEEDIRSSSSGRQSVSRTSTSRLFGRTHSILKDYKPLMYELEPISNNLSSSRCRYTPLRCNTKKQMGPEGRWTPITGDWEKIEPLHEDIYVYKDENIRPFEAHSIQVLQERRYLPFEAQSICLIFKDY